MSTHPRQFTVKFLDLLDQGAINPKTLAQDLLGFMSEADVKEFAERNGYFQYEEEEEEDGPDEGTLWYDTSRELD